MRRRPKSPRRQCLCRGSAMAIGAVQIDRLLRPPQPFLQVRLMIELYLLIIHITAAQRCELRMTVNERMNLRGIVRTLQVLVASDTSPVGSVGQHHRAGMLYMATSALGSRKRRQHHLRLVVGRLVAALAGRVRHMPAKPSILRKPTLHGDMASLASRPKDCVRRRDRPFGEQFAPVPERYNRD